MLILKITTDTLDDIETDLGVLFIFQDVRPLRGQAGLVDWRLNGRLSEIIQNHRFTGFRGETLLMPSGGRVGAKQLLILGLGSIQEFHDKLVPEILNEALDKIFKKQNYSFSITLSDLVADMFDWRNSVRLLASQMSGLENRYQVSLLEPPIFVNDARKRHMDFAFDVQVQYS